jgi:hypothetical protein
LVGNSVSVPVIEVLGKAIIETGVFKKNCESKPELIKLYPENLTRNQQLKRASW